MTSVQNSSAFPGADMTLVRTTPFAGQCRHRSGYDYPATYNTMACAMCFLYVHMDANVTLDHSTSELVIGSNEAYPEGTRMKIDTDNPETVAFVCGSLKQPSECWKWKDCCRQARICCQEQVADNQNTSKALRYSSQLCPGTWDGYACWPDTPAGHRPRVRCPPYVPYSVSEEYAYKTCTENATWYVLPHSDREWTDYTSCSKKSQHYQRLHTTTIVCNIITLTLLIPAITIFLCYKPLRQQHRIRLHLCLMVCSFLTSLCLMIWQITVFKKVLELSTRSENALHQQSEIGCILLMMLTRYSEIASFMWMFIEGFHLHRLLVHAFSVPKSVNPYYIFGFGFPLLPTSMYAIIRATNEKYNKMCWTDHAENYEWILAVPSVVALAVNVLFLLRIVFIMVTQLEPHPNEPSNFRRAVKAVVVLVPLFGVQFLLFTYRPQVSGEFAEVYELLNRVCSSLQGSVIVLVFCYFNKEVQGHLKTSFMRLLKRNGLQEGNSRSYTLSTHCVTDSSRNRASNGSAESSHMIPLRPINQNCTSDKYKTKNSDNVNINGDLNTIPEHVEENLFLQTARIS